MKVTKTKIPDVVTIEPEVFTDARGSFLESFHQARFEQAIGRRLAFVQDNQSASRRGVVRGLHYQVAPFTQGKLVRVLRGEIYDVAVDLRRGSPTLGHWIGERLGAENKRQLWIPEGFAHGFQAITETAEVLYKTTRYWSAAAERCIIWNDRDLGVAWPISEDVLLSDKDARGVRFAEAERL